MSQLVLKATIHLHIVKLTKATYIPHRSASKQWLAQDSTRRMIRTYIDSWNYRSRNVVYHYGYNNGTVR